MATLADGVVDGLDVMVPLAGLIDLEAERRRLRKEIDRLSGRRRGLEAKLANEGFINRAPEDVVAREREKLSAAELALEKLERNLGLLEE